MNNRQTSEKSALENFLDSEPALELLPWLNVKDISRLKQSSKRLNTCVLFQEPLLQGRLHQLAQHIVVKPDENETKKILDKNPELVLEKVKQVTDKTGRIIKRATPLQLAFGAGDSALCVSLEPYFELVCGSKEAGREAIRQQIKEKFGEENEQSSSVPPDLTAVIQAIANEEFTTRDATGKFVLSEATLNAIAEFRTEFAATQPMIIEKGMHFRFKTLLEICEKYAKATEQGWGDIDCITKCDLFEDGIMSFVLRYVPAHDAEIFSQGLYYLQVGMEPFKRSLITRNNENFYDALCRDSINFVLTGSCIDIVFGQSGNKKAWWPAGWSNFDPYHQKNWYQQKMEGLSTLRDLPSIQNCRLG